MATPKAFVQAGAAVLVTLFPGDTLFMSGAGTAQVTSGGTATAPPGRPLHSITAAGDSLGPASTLRLVNVSADAGGNGVTYYTRNVDDQAAMMSSAQALAGGFMLVPTRVSAAIKLMAASGGAATANKTFSEQKQALGSYSAWRPWYTNFDTAATLTITLAKGCGQATDLGDGSAGTYATAATALVVPQATGGANPQIVPGLAAGSWVIQSSVPRTDTPAANPLLLVLTQVAAASTTGNVGTAAPVELAALGYLEGAGVATGDFVTNPLVAHAMTRNGNLFHPCAAIEFLYDQPSVTVMSFGDSLIRGQTDGAGSAGFLSLDFRVCALKNAQNTGKIWSPCTFALSGQQHTPTYSLALAAIPLMKPRYVILRAYTVNDATTAAAFTNDYAELGILIETCVANGCTPILLTTGGTDGFNAAAAALLAQSNAKLLALRSAGAIVIDVAGLLYGSDGKLLPEWYGADGAHTHWRDGAHAAVAQLIANAIA